MNLIPVLSHSFKCQTCLMQRDTSAGLAPIFPANEGADEHIANNHMIICLVCDVYLHLASYFTLHDF